MIRGRMEMNIRCQQSQQKMISVRKEMTYLTSKLRLRAEGTGSVAKGEIRCCDYSTRRRPPGHRQRDKRKHGWTDGYMVLRIDGRIVGETDGLIRGSIGTISEYESFRTVSGQLQIEVTRSIVDRVSNHSFNFKPYSTVSDNKGSNFGAVL